jgi:hypothetical protein
MKIYRRNSLYGLVVFAVESIGGGGGGGFASDFCIVYITTSL